MNEPMSLTTADPTSATASALAGPIYVAGHQGLVGSAVVRQLRRLGHQELITATRKELDLTVQSDVLAFMEAHRPKHVVLAAAKVGGILANSTYPADFLRENLAIQNHVIDACHRTGVAKLVFLGSSCIYPKHAPQPITESALLTGPLEPTNEAYAIAKIAGIKACGAYNRQHGTNFLSLMPTNLYGPGDNYHPVNSHVIPALIRRFHEAKVQQSPTVAIWGTGTPLREFLFVDDMAAASVYVMNLPVAVYREHTQPMLSHINVGYGEDMTIAAVAEAIARTVGYAGRIEFDTTKPDGTPRKLMSSERLRRLGWRPQVDLASGLQRAYADFLQHQAQAA